MNFDFKLAVVAVSLVLSAAVPGPALAQEGVCDRACLSNLADRLLDSLPRHDPDKLPLAPVYAATENSAPAALNMMALWRTVTAVKSRFYVIDPVSQQIFFEATVAEGALDTPVFGRLKADNRKISEVELYANRSRGQGGFMFGPGPANLPEEWRAKVAKARIPSRAKLLSFGLELYDKGRPLSVPPSFDCVLYENGAVVKELKSVGELVTPPPPGPPPKGRAFRENSDGTVPVPCGLPPERPFDPTARVNIVDEEQGIVVAMGVTNGNAMPYLATRPTNSAFVPAEMGQAFVDVIAIQRKQGIANGPELKPMRVSGATFYVARLYDGKIQGLQFLINLGAPDGKSPWVVKP